MEETSVAPHKPPVVQKPSPNFRPRGGRKIDAIVIHHTASSNARGDLAHMRDPASKVSAHYLVDRDGTIYQLVEDAMAAWHAGKAMLDGDPDVNARSIGIELVNPGDGVTPFTDPQYVALEQLLSFLVDTYKISKEHVVGHRDVAPGRKVDPADNFDWMRVLCVVFA